MGFPATEETAVIVGLDRARPGWFEVSDPLSADDRVALRGGGMDALFEKLPELWDAGVLPQEVTLNR